jgi:MFS family permease
MPRDAPPSRTQAPTFNPWTLDALNFLLADVRGAIGPYLNVFLITERHWSQTEVGVVATIAGLVGLAAQSPIGAAIDESVAKRGVIALGLAVVSAAAVIIFADSDFWPVVAASIALAVAGDAFGPAIAALTLGLFPRNHLAVRLGRNSAFDHAGNVAIAAVAALVGYVWSQRAVFLLVPILSIFATAATLRIPGSAIDHARARDLDDPHADGRPMRSPLRYRELLRSKPLLVFVLTIALFHFANAPLLPLVGQKLSAAHPREATAMMSGCIVGAQAVMLPIALWVGRNADLLGRKPIFLIAFAVLPLRAALYPLSHADAWLLGVQLLDGVGAGIFGALAPLVVADVMRGTGRYNLAQGLVATAVGIGASLSASVAGVAVDRWGYSAAFFVLAGAAAIALAAFAAWMPETAPGHRVLTPSSAAERAQCE